jgi:signal transduction histidine kinase/ligand-binding sensor domain-containing protein
MFEKKTNTVFLIRPFRAAIVWLLMLLCSLPIAGQYRIDQWTADTGLPQNSVYAIKQTRDGYLWFATVDGLVRYDGVRFTIFNLSNSPGITSNRFISLLEDKNGDLWAGTEETGVTRLRGGQFRTFNRGDGLNTNYAYLLSDDSDGSPVVHGAEFSLTHFNGEKFVPYQPESDRGQGRPRKTGQYVNCQSNESASELRCLRRDGWFTVKNPDKRTYLDFIQTRAVEEEDGSLWVAFRQGGVRRFDAGGNVKIYQENLELPGKALILVPGAERTGLLSRDEQGAIWLTDLSTMNRELVTARPPESFIDLTYAYEDSEGSIWVGTIRGGLFRLRRQIINGYSKADGLLDNNVYPIYQDRQGTIWVGANGLYKYRDGRFETVRGTEEFQVQALAETRDGQLLFSLYGSKNSGLYQLDKEHLKLIYQPPQLTMSIYADQDGAVWIGGYYGLIRLKDGTATAFDEKDGLAARDVRIIIGDGAGGMWIGSYGGLNHYRDGQMQRWLPGEGLPMRTIRSLYLDADATLWIGSYDNGLARFKDGEFTHFTTQNGLFNDGAFQILEDDQNSFWLCSNRGIYRVRKDELNGFAAGRLSSITSIAYGKSDGMLSAECNGGRAPGGIRARDGRLWFPTQDGVAVVDPSQIKINPKPPPVVIEDIKIDNKPIPAETINSAKGDTRFVVQIEPRQQNFEIQYTALSFINSENLRFRYKLEGLDSDWIEAGTRRTAYFPHVAPGSYTFRVIAANADGVWNEDGARIKITILPPFYRTWWFYLLCVVSVFGIGFLIYRRRVSQLEREKKAQETLSRRLIESQENERKRLAGELHDSLSQNLVIIKNRAMMSLSERDNIDHAFEQMEEIAEAAVESLAEVREIAANLRPFQIDRLGLTKAIQSLIRKATSPNFQITAQIDNIDGLLVPEMQINLYRILQESLNNILKHSKATEATVMIEKTDKTINIEIRDNGRGFDPVSRDSENAEGGFGLTGMIERARILGSVLVIESTPGKGTAIRFQINWLS